MSDLTEVREMYLAEVQRADAAEAELAAANARLAELDWAPKRAKEVSDLCDEAMQIGASLVRQRQDDLRIAGMAVNALAGKWAKHVESAVVEIRRLGDELAALKIADAKRTVALAGAEDWAREASRRMGIAFPGVGLALRDYSVAIVNSALKRLETER